tara:strand:+ start:1807 stop:2592 length:786 start_codon:yes stop_codon:yes gene_type:complete
MNSNSEIIFQHIGQSGFFINFKSIKILIDPYLSNSVEELDSPDYKRLIPIPFLPSQLKDINWILITHDHLDHCDPQTLPLLYKHNPNAIFIGPSKVRKLLSKWGIPDTKIRASSKKTVNLGFGLFLNAIPAAHPIISYDKKKEPNELGWLLQYKEKKIYLSGDTSVCDYLIKYLEKFKPIDIAILPVNEDNFYKRKLGIIGNMSIREAFEFAEDINAKILVPVHWDLFEVNSVSPSEIKAVYESNRKWKFKLNLNIKKFSI